MRKVGREKVWKRGLTTKRKAKLKAENDDAVIEAEGWGRSHLRMWGESERGDFGGKKSCEYGKRGAANSAKLVLGWVPSGQKRDKNKNASTEGGGATPEE